MICLWPQQVRALSLVDQSKQYISWTMIISGIAVSIGRSERGASHVNVRPRLNSFT